MARAGLGPEWECLFANDFDYKKAVSYRANWGPKELTVADVATLTSADLPGLADLAWASFPCQDLSLAGGGAGLRGERSGTFRPFWKLIEGLRSHNRSPRIIVLENVCGALTSHGGKDFQTLCGSLADAGYLVGAMVINASHFVPQSRARLFMVGVKEAIHIPKELIGLTASSIWHPPALVRAQVGLSDATKQHWIWWQMSVPRARKKGLAAIVDFDTEPHSWFSEKETARLLEMMAPLHRAKIAKAMQYGKQIVGSVYKRIRPGGDGNKAQRAEIRFDDISGCLRTPAGGSSRQLIVFVHDKQIRVRLISARETARLMGLDEDYILPENYNEAYHLTGDGVVVPAVRHLASQLLEPLARAAIIEKVIAA